MEFESAAVDCSLEQVLSALAGALPDNTWGPSSEDWVGSRVILGDPGFAVKRLLVCSGNSLQMLTSGNPATIRKGDCVLATEVMAETRSVPPKQIFRWLVRVCNAIEREHASLVDLGNTWEVWEHGPAKKITERILSSSTAHRTYQLGRKLVEPAYKVVVYVPQGYQDAVRNAMCSEGAGFIGNYSHCTFQAQGQGTFLPLEGTNPFLGQKGRLEYADEFRLETIVRERRLKPVLKAMLQVHPYEEVAYDVLRLQNSGLELGEVVGVEFDSPVPRDAIKHLFADDSEGPLGEFLPSGNPVKRITASRVLSEASVIASAEFNADLHVFVHSSYEGTSWAHRLGIKTLKCSFDADTAALRDLCRKLEETLNRPNQLPELS